MTFETYHSQAWANHAKDTDKVASEFALGASLVETNEQLAQLVSLVGHVMSEHLAQWQEGVQLLESFRTHSKFVAGSEAEKSLMRFVATLKIANKEVISIKSFSHSDQVRILAASAAALAEHDTLRALDFLVKSLDVAENSINAKDPANRSLAVTGNNLATTLEEKTNRSDEETELMILAAETARKYWKVAGSWLNVERAEYRLTMTYLQAQEPEKALKHAKACLEICIENKADDLDTFFAFEAVAKAERANSNPTEADAAIVQAQLKFERMSEENKKWCEKNLSQILRSI